jgi:hypothetical protein
MDNGHAPWTANDGRQLAKLHAAGKSLNAIATEMGRAKATISKYATEAGLTFDRSRTAKATEAVVVDNRARRAGITARIYDDTEHVLAGVEAGRRGEGWNTILKGEYGAESVQVLDHIPVRDRREIADTLSRLLTSAAKLEAIDAAQQSSGVRDLLTGLAGRLGIVDGS